MSKKQRFGDDDIECDRIGCGAAGRQQVGVVTGLQQREESDERGDKEDRVAVVHE